MFEAWQQATENIENLLSEGDYVTWIKPVRYSHHQGSSVYLSVPNSFVKEWLEDHYLKIVTDALSAASGQTVTLDFIIRDDEEQQPISENLIIQSSNEPAATQIALPEPVFTNLNPKYTFDLFVSGTGNQFAHAAAMAVANNPADTYNPLFIYGGVGLGKSHLLNSIGHTIRANSPESNVCYCSAEKFMYEMVNHLRLKKMDLFRNRFRNVDVLLIDDIQFISGKTGTQEEFFYTFNALHDSHKQIVITSDKFPREISDLEERLRSRFEWGLIADIQPPDVETKIAILKKKSEITRIKLPDDVYYFLASSDTRNIRELEGMLIRLGAFSSLQNIPITLEMAKENLKDILGDRRKEVTVELIQKTVVDYFDMKLADLKSEKRLKNIVLARQVAIWLCRDMTKASYPDIGLKFGGKDHSTIIHSFKKIDKAIADDTKLSKILDEIKYILLK
ncbi:MAG: chromosomal replication initiation protein DnaA [Geobacteraceae bacterium GWC2_55_20]|nr:chromosomal replication initiator protein DnaA [Deltaproteobacteria bacterium]OGU04346.1 MAG: chromosomal replication initiation protein DnaA [Geobacteraceae bacterium GWC2_55_20]OGU26543.1 MAG: chromosomal replication initiation protein DnaA [Geobacteraceae bacterium GWF2_54_21]HBA73679.1 chromosomal replication initiator protein DnaA [Geobacter sp.]HCE66381.1 chromosomal replication initiator protein DnaA [Geobacter sp.]